MKRIYLTITFLLIFISSFGQVLTIKTTQDAQTYEINGISSGYRLIASEVDANTVRLHNETLGSSNTYKSKTNFNDFVINGVIPEDVTDAVERINIITKKLSTDATTQDSKSPVFHLYFSESLGPPTTLTVETVKNDYTIEVVDATDFSIGTWLGMFSGTGRYYWGKVSNVAGTTITLDSPIDFEFPVGASVLATNRNMAVDGSVTPRIFSIKAGSAGLIIDIVRINLSIVCQNVVELNLFGDQPSLTNGVVARYVDGEYRNLFNVKTNYEIGVIGYDIKVFEEIKTNDVNAILGKITYGGQENHGAVIRLGPNEELQLIIQDDLTGLEVFLGLAEGSEVKQ